MPTRPYAASQHAFDKQWASYWLQVQQTGPLTHTRYRLLLSELPPKLPAAPRILDVGCGPGIFLHRLSLRYPLAVLRGVEYSATALEAASPALRPLIVHGDILEVAGELGPDPFDLIVCSEVLEHVPDPVAVLKALANLAAPGATLLFSVPAGMRHWSRQDDAAGHLRRFEPAEFRALLEQSGFEVARLYTWGGPVSSLYNRAINAIGPAEAARTSRSRIGRLAARLATAALRIDDLWIGDRGFQLIARANKPVARR